MLRPNVLHLTPQPENTGALFTELADDLRGYLRRRVPEPVVDDLLQDVFVRVQARRDELGDKRSVAAWVFAIARTVVADHYRQRRAAKDPQPEVADDDADDPATASRVLGRWVAAAVTALPQRYREALELTEVEGLTQREAAQRLGLSYSGLKSRVQRGRAMLRRSLLRCCDVELDRRGGVVDYRCKRDPTCCAPEASTSRRTGEP